MKHSMNHLLIAAAVGTLIAGCASTPRRSSEVEQARSAVENLSGQPRLAETAQPDLKAARADLSRAERALQNGRPMDEVNQLAYLALRHAQAGEARVDAARSQAQVAQATEERQRLLLEAQKHQVLAAQQSAQAAQQQAQSAQQQVQAARDETQQARIQAQAAQQQLKQMQSEQLGAHQTDQGMVVTLSNVLFSTGKSTLQAGAHLQLERLASYLKDHPKERVLIEGSTDSTGSADSNQKLSGARAQAVAQALELRGVQQNQYQTIGLGEAYPVASNDTSAGRQQNRRVDIVFSSAMGQFSEAALSRQGAIRR
ncbi:MAG TPA: OmpA family protein [Steroidobacteraceae bacterium]|nr:OmpA family protein [Steroidobacteraceae bacterium]